MAIKNQSAPKAQYLSLKFKSNSELEKWLKTVTAYVITLKDNGQDLLRLWVDMRGEILNTNAQSMIWVGKFIQTGSVAPNDSIVMFMGKKIGWRLTDFEIKSITTYHKNIKN